MPARGRGRNDAAGMIDKIVAIASDPEGHKQRLAEFEERQEAAAKAEAAASVRIEEAGRREAEVEQREIGIEARQADVDKVAAFKTFAAEQLREIEAERLEQEKLYA